MDSDVIAVTKMADIEEDVELPDGWDSIPKNVQ
jgi:hypothetical protein